MNNIQKIAIAEYDYPLPDERIARYPLEQRDCSKLLLYKSGNVGEDVFSNLPSYIPSGSLMVFNNTKVIQARLRFRKETGAQIEYTSDAQYHIFTLTKTKREVKGYRQVVLKYAKTDLLLHYMLLEEHSGNYNTYILTSHTLQPPTPDKYLIPKK